MAATKLISLERLSEYDVAIKKVLEAADAKKYEAITFNKTTGVLSFFKSADTTGTPDFTLTLPGTETMGKKADKVAPTAAGNVATLGADGNLVDGKVALADLEKHADLAAVAESGKAEDVSVADADNHFTGATVEAVLSELFTAISNAKSDSVVSVVKSDTAEDGFLSTYHVTQDGVNVGASINIPKDFVVKDASVKAVTKADKPVAGYAVGDRYVDLEINVTEGAADSKHLYFKADELAPVYKGSVGTELTVDVAADGTISATITSVDGSKLTANSVAKTALAKGVQDSLDKADAALPAADAAAVATSGKAADVEYKAANSATGAAAVSVEKALADLEAAVGKGGSVASQIKTAVEALDSKVAADDGYALTGVTVTDGKITGKTQVQFMKAADYAIASKQDIKDLFHTA